MTALASRPARLAVAVAAVVAAALTAFVVVWFQPQKLFIDDRVDEALPSPRAPASRAPAAQAPGTDTPTPATLSVAPFRSYEHATRGQARLLRVADGRRFVRFEGFRTSNGPLLRVYLSAATARGPGGAFDDRFVDLGALKGNIGAQNYRIPAGVRLSAYRSVVVWCKRFGVPFAAAALSTA